MPADIEERLGALEQAIEDLNESRAAHAFVLGERPADVEARLAEIAARFDALPG